VRCRWQVEESSTSRQRRRLPEHVLVSARVLAYSLTEAFDINAQLIEVAKTGGDLARSLEEAGFLLAGSPEESFRVIQVRRTPA
jgi:hypothetical protein